LFLLVFTWVYLGDDIYIDIKSLGIHQHVLTPFRSLKWLIGVYLALGFMNFIVLLVGTVLVQLASFCTTTAPKLYTFSLFLIAFFWIMFFIAGCYSIKLFFGTTLAKMIKEQIREETMEEVEERVFKKHFLTFDPELKHQITREDFPKLLQLLGIFVPDEEIAQLMDTLDAEKSGFLKEDIVYEWFKEITKEDDQTNKKLENISDDEDSDNDKDGKD
jgi:predicted membrane protein